MCRYCPLRLRGKSPHWPGSRASTNGLDFWTVDGGQPAVTLTHSGVKIKYGFSVHQEYLSCQKLDKSSSLKLVKRKMACTILWFALSNVKMVVVVVVVTHHRYNIVTHSVFFVWTFLIIGEYDVFLNWIHKLVPNN